MNRNEIDAKVKAMLVEHLGVDAEAVQPDALLVPDHDDRGLELKNGKPNLGADSLDVVELVMACEEEFGVEISDDIAEPLNRGTVNDLADLIERLTAERA